LKHRTLAAALVLVAGFAILSSQPAHAAGGPFGLGIIIGEPTGVSVKYRMTEANAIDGAIAWSLSGDNDMHLHGDYLHHWFDVIQVSKGRLPLYAGLGARFVLRENRDDHVGIRIPVGLAYLFAGAPFDIFFELVPVLDLTPDTDFDIDGAIGARFWF
jgi:hypothetical protein